MVMHVVYILLMLIWITNLQMNTMNLPFAQTVLLISPSPCDTPIYLALITCRLFLTGTCSAWRASLPSFSSWDLCSCQRARGGWLSMRGRNTLGACFRPWGGTSTLTKNSIASKIATLKHEMVNVRKILVVINKWIYIYNILHAIKNIWSNVIYIIKYRVMLLYYDFFQNS